MGGTTSPDIAATEKGKQLVAATHTHSLNMGQDSPFLGLHSLRRWDLHNPPPASLGRAGKSTSWHRGAWATVSHRQPPSKASDTLVCKTKLPLSTRLCILFKVNGGPDFPEGSSVKRWEPASSLLWCCPYYRLSLTENPAPSMSPLPSGPGADCLLLVL